MPYKPDKNDPDGHDQFNTPNFVRSPRLINEIGQMQSAPWDAGQFLFWGKGTRVLFIGLGPEPEQALAALCEHLNQTNSNKLQISYTEAPGFARQMPATWQDKIPANWQKLATKTSLSNNHLDSLTNKPSANSSPKSALSLRPSGQGNGGANGESNTGPNSGLNSSSKSATNINADLGAQAPNLPDISSWLGDPCVNCIAIYKPGLKLFPSYFVPLAAQIKLAQLNLSGLSSLRQTQARQRVNAKPKILLAGAANGLLIEELAENFKSLGCELQVVDPQELQSRIANILSTNRPDLFLSINFSGLDPLGEIFYLLNQADVQVATWCVDNPWHLLSFMRAPWWRELHIFVTDHSFIAPLQAHGAKQVSHLPLATNPKLFCPQKNKESLRQNIVFAGRTEFPNKNKFFAGCKTSEILLEPALMQTKQDKKANFDFWVQKLHINPLWPGNNVREAGFAAETCALAWRTACVEAAIPLGITVYGNPQWQEQLPAIGPYLLPAVDYYFALPAIYASSQIVLNITSLLLPAGLTQRNFDAWAAGSVCLTDKTPGLDIFPAELLEHICYEKPEEIVEKAELILKNKSLQAELKTAWQKLVINEHSYKQRVEKILQQLSLE